MKPPVTVFVMCAVAGVLASAASAHQVEQLEPERSITRIRGELYRVDAGPAVTVFLVTPEGIILGDPLDRPTALWLKNEFAERFPDRPVRFVVHSHHRFDRSEGAPIFTETATVVAHRNFNEEVERARRESLAPLAALDRNTNGKLEAAELADDPQGVALRRHDRDRDGRITPGELYTSIRRSESDYTLRRTITLGGQRIELIHPGAAYGTDTTVLYFPAERVVFAENYPGSSGLFSFASVRAKDVLEWLHRILELDFDTVISGRGETGSRADLAALDRYLNDMFAGVVARYEAGLSIDELQAGSWLDTHSGTRHYADRRAHIAYIYRTVRVIRIGLHGAAAFNAVSRNTQYCASFTDCQAIGGLVPAGTTGVSVSVRRFVAAAEATVADQLLAWKTSADYDEAFARRETSVSFLVGYSSAPRTRFSYILLAGPAVIAADTRGVYRYKERFPPTGGRHPFGVHDRKYGFTFGADLMMALGPRFTVVVPLRTTQVYGENTDTWPRPTWPGRSSVYGGIGLRLSVFRHVG